MNPISNLIDKKFNELTAIEVNQVIEAYKNQNSYFDSPTLNVTETMTAEIALTWFSNSINPIHLLKDFFNFWTE